MENVTFFYGSFDPFTKGHMSILTHLLLTSKKVIVAVGSNPKKENSGLFSAEMRMNLIRKTVDDFVANAAYDATFLRSYVHSERMAAKKLQEQPEILQIVSYRGLSIDAAIRCGVTQMVRGKRTFGSLEDEHLLQLANERLLKVRNCHIEQKLIESPNNRYRDISSSGCRNLCKMGEYIAAASYVTPSVHNELMKIYLKPLFQTLCDMDWEVFVRKFEGRSYHNLSHIAYCLNRLSIYTAQKPIDNRTHRALRTACFFHNYETTEKLSAEAALKACESLTPDKDYPMFLRNLILATDYLTDNPLDEAGKIMRDIDLSILFDEENYGNYAYQIRQEYAEYTLMDFITERCKFLKILKKRLEFSIYPQSLLEKALNLISKEINYYNNI